MFLYKDNRFHFSNISFCLPDNVYLNTTCEEYEDCIELHPVDEDFRIIIFGDYSEGGAKQFFAKGGEEANVLSFLFHGKTTLDMDETCRHPAVVALLQSLKNE